MDTLDSDNDKKGNMAASPLGCGICGSDSFNILRGYCSGCEKIHLLGRCAKCTATINLASADPMQEHMEFADLTPEQVDSMKNFIEDSLISGRPIAGEASARMSRGFNQGVIPVLQQDEKYAKKGGN